MIHVQDHFALKRADFDVMQGSFGCSTNKDVEEVLTWKASGHGVLHLLDLIELKCIDFSKPSL